MATSIRVRMYRPGFGDCFLVTFDVGAAEHHVLIDFGAHMHGEIGTMDAIMADIEQTTKSKLDLIVATHAHRDHISGFGKFVDKFGAFQIGEVWLPWTDNPKDKDAASLQGKHLALYDGLDSHLRNKLGATEADPKYAAALEALSNLKGNESATTGLASGFGSGATVRFLAGGSSIDKVGKIDGLSAEILGPPRDAAYLQRMDPPPAQHFLTEPGHDSSGARPFPKLEIKVGDPDYLAITAEHQPVLSNEEITALQTTMASPERLALALDSIRNNTSLVILFRYRGKTLLFPGDAQWGSWQSWIGTDKARTMLATVDFFKVAHHGSENATPVDVVNNLTKGGLAAMVSTQIEPFPTIPRIPLLQDIEKHCHVAVRSDWVDVTNKDAPKAPKPMPPLPKGFSTGAVWIDYQFQS